MKKLLILGAGTAGTMMANKMAHALDRSEWQITIVDRDGTHHYQPGYLFVPFGVYTARDVVKPRKDYLAPGIDIVISPIDVIEPDQNQVRLTNGRILAYDYLIIATGTRPVPTQTEGLAGPGWQKNAFDFYTLEGAVALARKLQTWEGGRMVINIVEMPIKCPVAPLEFAFLADWFFTTRGLRDKVEIEYVTPLPGAFTKPKASALLGGVLDQKKIKLTADYSVGRVDTEERKLFSWDEREVPYDLLVTVPTNMGDESIARSGFGDELNYVPTDKHTLRTKVRDNIFALGDATDLPASKAGSVVHFQADILVENLLAAIDERPLHGHFDGHANCFIESGFGKAFLIDFNYDTEPLPGLFPFPGVGPLALLEETRMNHYGKMMFRWVYWNVLLRGLELPMDSALSMAGKRR
ncbi:MAG: NAD(P)/FAD-dependent oxidoreductase [Candidatus Didemnitutus sp.]|nr:NAD(P)/FAD-dependent oxidoreductase [Candidatus Didemnitutus sp.]